MMYLVYGYPRSGTSMMMAALKAGGISPAWSEVRESIIRGSSDNGYSVNECCYETEYDGPHWPLQYDGMAVKVMPWWLDKVAAGDYLAVVMRRDRVEMASSYEAAFRNRWLWDYTVGYDELIGNAVEYLRGRNDVRDVQVFDYQAVVEDPLAHMVMLRDAGWPIDAKAAATIVDPNKYRFRTDKLIGDVTHACVFV